MAATNDFRDYAFEPTRIDAAGRNVAQHVYWKLYALENLVRVMVHSILSAEVKPLDWWVVAVAGKIKGDVTYRKSEYATRPAGSKPGNHDIYYVFLPDLTKIITANSHLFRPLIPDIDAWVVRMEQVRLPRNIVCHMNWPNKADRQLISVLYTDLQRLLDRLAASGMALSIP